MEIIWHRLEDLAFRKFGVVTNEPGIYFVRWSRGGKAVPVPRLGDVDSKGILYIGSAKNLKRRIRQLWKGVNRKGRHTIGKTIIFCKIFEIVNLDEYEISWKELKTHDQAIGQEWTALVDYSQKYKEPPPLNLSLRRKMFGIWGIAIWGRSRYPYKSNEFVRSVID